MESSFVGTPPDERNAIPSDLGQELTEGFAGRYIGHKARQLIGHYGYVPADQADLEQELRLRLFQRVARFDPVRAAWNSFVVAVVDRQLATIIAAHQAKKRSQAIQRFHAPIDTGIGRDDSSGLDEVDDRYALPPSSRSADRADLDLVELQLDIEAVVPRLPRDLRLVWEWLQSDNVRRTARALGVSPMTIYHRLRRLRAAFISAESE